MIADPAERAIDGAAALLTAGLVAGLLFTGAGPMRRHPAPPAPPVEIALTLAAPPAPPPPAPLPAPQAPETQQAPAPAATLRTPRPMRRHGRPPNHIITPAAMAVAEPASAPSPAPSAAPPVANPTEDALYTGRIHAAIERNKRVPASPAYRMMRPHGTVTVTFILTRAGQPGGVRVTGSSGSALLDDQAAATVAGCAYPPMPPAAFAGQQSHLFQVEVTFPPFGSVE